MQSEQLKPEEFDAHIAHGTFRLSFIGMSNAGKSYRSKVLQKESSFLWYHVDEEIQKALGFVTMGEISAWIGYPTSPHYRVREKRYLELENACTKQAAIETNGKNLVFDTTGSVVHLEQETLIVLKENCLVVHLDVGEGSLSRMVEQFFLKPKPVAWCGYFFQEAGESNEAALRRSYPILLRERLKKYRQLAHVTIPAKDLYDTSGVQTLEIIKRYLS